MDQLPVLSEYEQHIYNAYLRAMRKRKNLPYKNRKDFSNIGDVDSNYLKKISIFLSKFPHIKLDDFINAPYIVYPDETYFGLDYYTTLKATKAYTLFQKRQELLDPDNDEQLVNIIESLKYISAFCTEQNLEIENYPSHLTNNTPSFILHLKEHRINVYSLFGFPSFEKNLKVIESDLLKFILGDDFYNNLSGFRLKFFASKKALKLVELGIQKIKNKIKTKTHLINPTH